jgi:DNA polymerase-3 subunit alpha
MLSEGMSFEVFQFESDGMQDVLKRAKPGKIEDLIALNALYRPGPMANIPRFIDCKNGRQKITYPHSSLADVLEETYGVITYQEQVMQVARIIAGYSLGQADILRKAMGKKIKEILDKEKIPFLEGAARQGFTREKAEEIFDMLIPFAGYGFNKSHAAGYAVLAYRTAYLKANYPAEFMAANLINEIGSADKDKLSVCIAEARKMGIAVDPPDINRSNKLFTISEGRIVYGFLGIKGLGDGPSDEIVNSRKDGPYRDFIDFLNRVDIKAIGKSVIERLIQTGAFDNLGTSRETLLGNLERAADYIQNIKDEKKFGQGSLFGDTGEKEYIDFEFEEFPETSREDKLKIEKELIGFYFSGHPMDEYKSLWQSLVKVNLGNEETLVPGSQILVGLLKNIKTITTSRGEKMAFASLEDYNGEIEITFFPGIWEKCKDSLETGKVAILKGKIDYQQSRDKRSFTVDESLDVGEAERLSKADEARSRKWEKYRNIWKYAAELELRIPDLGNPAGAEPGTYTVLGILKSLRTHKDKKDKEMAFGTIEDFRGEIDLVFFSRAWENCKALTAVDEVVALKGTIEPARDRNSGKVVFVVSSVQDLNKLLRAAAKKASEPASYREIHIRLAASAANNEAALNSLKGRLDENPGSCPVFIHIPASSQPGVPSEEGTASKGSSSETVIRTANQINAVFILSDLSPEKCAAVADVWGK